jgi:hypothetical protein
MHQSAYLCSHTPVHQPFSRKIIMDSMPLRPLAARQNVCVIAGLFVLSACEFSVPPTATSASTQVQAEAAAIPVRPTAPVLEAKAPAYPALAIYIVYREYVHLSPGLRTLSDDDPRYQEYMERRLRELYPTRGYAGMMREAVAEARRNRLLVQQYERGMREYERRMRTYTGAFAASFGTLSTCDSTSVDLDAGADTSWAGRDEFAVPPDEQLPTIQMEIDSLQLVGPEVDAIYYYESLATGTYAGGGGSVGEEPINMTGAVGEPTRDDLIRAAAEGGAPGEISAQVSDQLLASIALGVVGAWKAYRVQQAADRAHRKSTEFYPDMGSQDTRRDAHRHLYVNMMLRRYVGATAAKLIMDQHESESTGAAKVMNLHNNDIGRSLRYHAFRGHWLWDRWDWREWADKVRYYIDNAANAEYIPEWYLTAPTIDEAWAREACVADTKYIYFVS